MRKKVVIDTNVIVSSLLSSNENSATVRIISMIFKGSIIPVVTDDILKEYEEVLRRKKFSFPEEAVSTFLAELKRKAIITEPVCSFISLPDGDDRPFFETMLADDEAILVTGNLKHFPVHERIMTARTFLDFFIAEKLFQ